MLEKAGFPPLLELEAKTLNKIEKAFQRGKIRNHEEYYLLTEIAGQIDAQLDDAQRKLINKMLLEYEERAADRG